MFEFSFFRMRLQRFSSVVLLLFVTLTANSTKLVSIQVVDHSYLLLHFSDGEMCYQDTGKGEHAFEGHSKSPGRLIPFGTPLRVEAVASPASWVISSDDGRESPVSISRKTKPLNTSPELKSMLDHWLYLRLPTPMRQGKTYTVHIPRQLGADVSTAQITFDVWNSQTEAIHVNIVGYHPSERQMTADLYQWLGDGGQRDYHSFEGKQIYLYNIGTRKRLSVGKVAFWKPSSASSFEAGGKNLVGTDVWKLDFRAPAPGRYRLVVQDVGCSMDFEVSPEVYREPFRYSVLGYYYMRLGEPVDTPRVVPVPRQPRFIPGVDPQPFVIYKTDLTPWSPEWRAIRSDVWDDPHFKRPEASVFYQHRLPGHPTSDHVVGGHSDAFDWDRHLAHVSNIYDLLLPYILTRGVLNDDNLGIRESGNGIPDLLDEARNEVDFFLSARDGEGYSQGVTNPSIDHTVMFQAGCTTMAAWANAANCAMMSFAMQIAGQPELADYYKTEAMKAYRYAGRQSDLQLDELQDVGSAQMRGRDFKQLAAAFLYNVTGDRAWEDVMAAESMIKDDHSLIVDKNYRPSGNSAHRSAYYQLWAAAAYLACPYERHYASLYQHLLNAVQHQADENNLKYINLRPSRRVANDARWTTSQNLQLLLLAHVSTPDAARKAQIEHAMYTEAGWGLGRNPSNCIQMTGLGQRHYTSIYTTGQNDGVPEVHPGQTPFNGTETWSHGDGGDAQILLRQCYPSWSDGGWPQEESHFNQRYMWVNGEFTPRETMRGKMALLAYLYALSKAR